MAILIILALAMLNGFFALAEIALVSVKRSRIEQKAALGNKNAQTVLRLLDKPENFLSSIQVGITLIGIIAGAYGGTTLVNKVIPFFEEIDWLAPAARELAFILVIGSITYFSIVIGELIPKSIAIRNAETIALLVAPPIRYFTFLAFPVVKLLSGSTKLVLRLLKVKKRGEEMISEEDLIHMLKMARRTGVLLEEESNMHENLFLLSDQQARNLKTHRKDVQWLELNESVAKIRNTIKNSPHTMFPVCQGAVDEIVGFISAKDFLQHYTEDGFTLTMIMREPVFISETMYALNILRLFKKKRQYLGFVVDEFGDFEGIITLHDLMEVIIGELPEEEVSQEPDIVIREDRSLLVSGSTPVHRVNMEVGKALLKENPKAYTTLGGFIICTLNGIPGPGFVFTFNGYSFEIVDVDGSRIDKVILKPAQETLREKG